VPEHAYSQEFAHRFLPKNADLRPEPRVEQRNDAFICESNRLALAAVQRLLARLPGLDRRRISHLIKVSWYPFLLIGHLHLGLPVCLLYLERVARLSVQRV
jgi:hypothetical protein